MPLGADCAHKKPSPAVLETSTKTVPTRWNTESSELLPIVTRTLSHPLVPLRLLLVVSRLYILPTTFLLRTEGGLPQSRGDVFSCEWSIYSPHNLPIGHTVAMYPHASLGRFLMSSIHDTTLTHKARSRASQGRFWAQKKPRWIAPPGR